MWEKTRNYPTDESDILGEIEQSGLIMSKNQSDGRYVYSKQYMLSVPGFRIIK